MGHQNICIDKTEKWIKNFVTTFEDISTKVWINENLGRSQCRNANTQRNADTLCDEKWINSCEKSTALKRISTIAKSDLSRRCVCEVFFGTALEMGYLMIRSAYEYRCYALFSVDLSQSAEWNLLSHSLSGKWSGLNYSIYVQCLFPGHDPSTREWSTLMKSKYLPIKRFIDIGIVVKKWHRILT